MKLFKRILLHIFGFAIMTFAVSLIIKTEQGAFPYDAISYYTSKIIDHPFFTIGVSSMIFGTLWVILNLIIIRKATVLWSFVIVFGFGYFMDLWLLYVLDGYNVTETWLNVVIVLGALLLLGFSIGIIILNEKLPLAPSEVFMIRITKHTKKSWISKIYIEGTLIVIAIILASIAGDFVQISWFTFVSVILVGPIIHFFQSILSKFISPY